MSQQTLNAYLTGDLPQGAYRTALGGLVCEPGQGSLVRLEVAQDGFVVRHRPGNLYAPFRRAYSYADFAEALVQFRRIADYLLASSDL